MILVDIGYCCHDDDQLGSCLTHTLPDIKLMHVKY